MLQRYLADSVVAGKPQIGEKRRRIEKDSVEDVESKTARLHHPRPILPTTNAPRFNPPMFGPFYPGFVPWPTMIQQFPHLNFMSGKNKDLNTKALIHLFFSGLSKSSAFQSPMNGYPIWSPPMSLMDNKK
jgi:hypothetical protein